MFWITANKSECRDKQQLKVAAVKAWLRLSREENESFGDISAS